MQIFFGHCHRPKLSLNTLVLILGSLVCTNIANTTWAQELPSLGDGASRMVSPQLERRIGEAFLRQLHANLPISKDVLVQYFVEQHMHNLAQHAQMRGSLQSIIVVDNPEINAFAAPGGIIGINLGLLLYAQDIMNIRPWSPMNSPILANGTLHGASKNNRPRRCPCSHQ